MDTHTLIKLVLKAYIFIKNYHHTVAIQNGIHGILEDCDQFNTMNLLFMNSLEYQQFWYRGHS